MLYTSTCMLSPRILYMIVNFGFFFFLRVRKERDPPHTHTHTPKGERVWFSVLFLMYNWLKCLCGLSSISSLFCGLECCCLLLLFLQLFVRAHVNMRAHATATCVEVRGQQASRRCVPEIEHGSLGLVESASPSTLLLAPGLGDLFFQIIVPY